MSDRLQPKIRATDVVGVWGFSGFPKNGKSRKNPPYREIYRIYEGFESNYADLVLLWLLFLEKK